MLAAFRSDMSDTEVPYLWSDADVYRYIDDAQKTFCRKTDGISDATSFLTQLSIAQNDGFIVLDKRILKIRAATRADTGEPVEVLNSEDLARQGLRFVPGTTGSIKALVIGEEKGKARPYPISNAALTLNLTIFRLPLLSIEGDDDLEVDEEHHNGLLLWVKSRAYLKDDANCYDKEQATNYEARFAAYCDEAMREERKRQHKIRIVQYGGL